MVFLWFSYVINSLISYKSTRKLPLTHLPQLQFLSEKARGIGVIEPPQGLLNPARPQRFFVFFGRENLQETMPFPMKNGGFMLFFMLLFPLKKSKDTEITSCQNVRIWAPPLIGR